MKTILGGVIAGVLLCLGFCAFAIYVYFGAGYAPVAVSSPPMPLAHQLAKLALHARLRKDVQHEPPISADEISYLSGAHVYLEHCAVCHGLPGKEQTAIALGESPMPPHLFRGKGVTDDEPGETYWKVSNGIRMTGMPGFQKSLSSTQMWQVSVLLANADKLPVSVRTVLAGGNSTASE
jgi:mono/diheme cytochrome c family protein